MGRISFDERELTVLISALPPGRDEARRLS